MSTVIVNPLTNRTERHETMLRLLYDLLATKETVAAAIVDGKIKPETVKELTMVLAKAIQEPLAVEAQHTEQDLARIILAVFLGDRGMRWTVARHFARNKRVPRTKRRQAVSELKDLCEDILGGEWRN